LAAAPLRGGHASYVTYTPSQILSAYGYNASSLTNLTGVGQTIAIVDAFDAPNIVGDVASFDTKYGVAAFASYTGPGSGSTPWFEKVGVDSSGAAGSTPGADTGWAVEISLDVEWAHVAAPGANIMLVEAASNSNTDLLAAVGYAKHQSGVVVVSMSWGESEFLGENSLDGTFVQSGVTFVAASGDNGSFAGPSWPAVSPNVLAVGGTQLTINSSGVATSETGWSGSGGGPSAYEVKPSYQNTGNASNPNNARGNPDLAYNASGQTTYAVIDTYGYSGTLSVYGTSAGAPQVAGIIARADQGRGPGNSLSNAQALLYGLPSTNFYDVTSGSSGKYSAGPGFDFVTGLGSVNSVGTGSRSAPTGVSTLISALISAPDSVGGTSVNGVNLSSGTIARTRSGTARTHGTTMDIFTSPTGFVTLTPAATTTTFAVNSVVPVTRTPGSSTTLLSVSRDFRLSFDVVGPHFQSDGTGGGDAGTDVGANPADNPMPPVDDGDRDDD
jgi:subtilase family serine protease